MPVFADGVASGDPLTDRVVIWTRITTDGTDAVPVAWAVTTPDGDGVAAGSVEARAEHDWTVHVDVDGLQPSTPYRYAFQAMGELSPEGRTRTLPVGEVQRVRFAQVSCAKFNAGFFNAYARIADRSDLDFVLHLGDYIYEASQTPPASQTPGADIGRPFDPPHECKTLADYRRRYAQYHRDPDVQRMHAAHPLVAAVDDHEFADGAWRDGAAEHRDERDGPWAARRAAAFRAHWEWLPARLPDPADPERAFRSLALGDLADLLLIDLRTRRDEPVGGAEMHDPARTMLGMEQREWLFRELSASKARWRLLGNPSVLARTWNDDLPQSVRELLVKVKMIDHDTTGPDPDQWDGYPAERSALLRHIQQQTRGNVVVLSGDVHVGMAIELRDEELTGNPVAVEFVNTSLTSQNLDDKMGWRPRTEGLPFEADFLAGMPDVKWCDFDSHGYSLVDVTRDRVSVEWWAVATVLERAEAERRVAAWEVRDGSPRVQRTGGD